MRTIKFYILDVFASEKYTGNQLAVFVDLEQVLCAKQMLKITREINFAESAFIRSIEEDGSFGVRIFTTEYEVPFAGHPTLGTAYVLAKYFCKKSTNNITLKLQKGAISVTLDCPENLEHSRFTMQQAQPIFGNTFVLKILAEALDLPLNSFETSMPVQIVNTGLPYLIIFLKDLKSISNLRLDSKRLKQFLIDQKLHKCNADLGLTCSLFFVTTETINKENHYHTRMFVLEDGVVWEDAATGSANGCFLAYLLKYHHPLQSVRVEQGYEMGRKSILYLDGAYNGSSYTLKVGGDVVPVSEGLWSV